MSLDNIEFIDVASHPQSAETWDKVVASAPMAWVWTTRTAHAFRLSTLNAARELHSDSSFFLLQDGKPIGLMPLIIRRVKLGNADGLEASYREAPLPWPNAIPGTASLDEIETALLNEAEARCLRAGAGKLSLMLSPPHLESETEKRFAKILHERKYLDCSYPSYLIGLNSETLTQVRERYRRDVRKHVKNYQLDVLSGSAIPDDMHRIYMELHRRDSGALHRPEETFRMQIEALRKGDGFITLARRQPSNQITGALIIWLTKDAAYDASVAVDPEFQREQVSHLLKWKAIEHLLAVGAKFYELGRVATPANCLWQPTDKNYGISFFKEGWARDGRKTVFEAMKFFDPGSLQAFWNERYSALLSHQNLNTSS